jgi:hypothetical protein
MGTGRPASSVSSKLKCASDKFSRVGNTRTCIKYERRFGFSVGLSISLTDPLPKKRTLPD